MGNLKEDIRQVRAEVANAKQNVEAAIQDVVGIAESVHRGLVATGGAIQNIKKAVVEAKTLFSKNLTISPSVETVATVFVEPDSAFNLFATAEPDNRVASFRYSAALAVRRGKKEDKQQTMGVRQDTPEFVAHYVAQSIIRRLNGDYSKVVQATATVVPQREGQQNPITPKQLIFERKRNAASLEAVQADFNETLINAPDLPYTRARMSRIARRLG